MQEIVEIPAWLFNSVDLPVPLMRVRDRVMKSNKNALILVCGQTGAGKSWFALKCCEALDPEFTLERVVFNSRDFLNLIRSGNLKRGSCILFDEAGIGAIGKDGGGAASREFMSSSNKSLAYFIQAFRSMNLVCFFTVPVMSMVDTQLRSLAHFLIEITHIDKSERRSHCKWFQLFTSSRYGKVYNYYLLDNNGRQITDIAVSQPSVKLRHAYEKKKEKWLENLADGVIEKLTPQEKKGVRQRTPFDPAPYVSELLAMKARGEVDRITETFILYYYKDLTQSSARVVREAIKHIMNKEANNPIAQKGNGVKIFTK